MAWNLPENYANSSYGILEGMSRWAYDVTNGWFWASLLLGFCVVIFASTSRFGEDRAMGYASYVGIIGALFFAVLRLMPWGTAAIFFIVGAIGIAVSVSGKARV